MDEQRSATASDQVNTKVWREAQYAMMSLPRTRHRLRSKALSAAFYLRCGGGLAEHGADAARGRRRLVMAAALTETGTRECGPGSAVLR